MQRWQVWGALLGAAFFSSSTPLHDAVACGGFFSARPNPERRPSLAYEQALIVHDAKKGREHFIREIVFRASDETFGFVVPTPTKPEVAKVAKSPFAKLRETFPYDPPIKGGGIGLGDLGGMGHGAGSGTGGGTVTVLDVQKVGSFTAFVLAADDAGALAKWLKDNGLVVSSEAEPWLRHYVRAKFYYVAMRYDPPKHDMAGDGKASGADAKLAANAAPKPTRAEVVRISFDTPRPYYPYYEPDKPAGAPDEPRMLEVWLATDGGAAQPLAVREKEGKREWLRPFAEGVRYDAAARDQLGDAMSADAAFLPTGELRVQRFVDQKRRRNGWGDVVFVPEPHQREDRASEAALRKLAPILDPSLLPPEAR